jgi:quinol monooxygenase YgiN
MIIVTGRVLARPETFEELRRISLEHVHRSRLEPGCLMHSVHEDAENGSQLVFLEHWLDADALKAHFGVPASRAFAKALGDLAAEPPTMETYTAEPVVI